jgi:probable rRNA maturation factor
VIHFQFSDAVFLAIDQPGLEQAASAALDHVTAKGDLTVVLTDDAQLHDLNRQFLGIDAPTDVLSFPSGEIDPETGAPYLGDVLISVPRAQEQATAKGHALQAELSLLVVHGVLHLLGYDHADVADKQTMWQAQATILARLGYSIEPPP